MKSKWIVAGVLLLVVCVVSQGVMAQPQGRGQGGRGFGGGQGGGQGMRGAPGGGQGMRGGAGGGMFGLDLTEEQQAKMAKMREGMREKMQNASPEERQAIMEKMRKDFQAILTEEQRARMGSMGAGRGMGTGRGMGGEAGMRPGMGQGQPQGPRTMGPLDFFDAVSRRLELSKEQQEKIAKIRAEAMKKLMNDIKAVLTKEQNERFEQAQKRLAEAQKARQAQGRGRPEGDRPIRGGEGGDRDSDRPERGGERGERPERGGERGGRGR